MNDIGSQTPALFRATKRAFPRLLAAGLLAGLLTASGAGAWSLPPDGLRLEGEARQTYMAERMDGYFHPKADAAKPAPFAAPEGWTHSAFQLEGLGVERLERAGSDSPRVVLQLHGGAYVGPLHDRFRELAVKQGTLAEAREVYMLHYRLAPEHAYPAALEDAARVYEEILRRGARPEQVVVMGDSAGGNLALALALHLKEQGRPQPGLLLLLSPWGSMETDLPSRAANAKRDCVLGDGAPLNKYVVQPSPYAKGMDLRDPRLSPMYADLRGLPPMLIQAGGYELLLDDSMALMRKAVADGVDATLTVYPAMPHDFPLVMPELGESVDAFREIRDFVARHMGR